MPPTPADSPKLTTASACAPIVIQANTAGTIQMSPTGHSPLFVSHMQPVQIMNTCAPAQCPVQMTDFWTQYMPIAAPPGPMMVQTVSMFQQGSLSGPPPVHIHQQPVVSPSIPPQSLFNPLTNSTNMEVVWHGFFDQLFSQLRPDQWSLMPVSDIPQGNSYRIFNDSAKVRFLCQTCGKAWTSMKGRVVFVYHLDHQTKSGFVLFKLFGQQCQKCSPGAFEHAMWYPEEVYKVVTNVFHAVGKTYYGFPETPVYRERRKGKPRTQHNAELCQACADNVCLEGNFERALMVC